MDQFPAALEHGPIEEVFADVFFVTGAMETELQGLEWKFSRNMVVIREGGRLILINSIRLSDEGLAQLDQLGSVTDVIRLGALHGRDDPFYIDRYQAQYWSLGDSATEQTTSTCLNLETDTPLPISDAAVFSFQTTQVPEAILHLKRNGGILVACDALQNWIRPDHYFSEDSRQLMQEMGFFTPANLGPVWVQVAAPEADDFVRLQKLKFRHALCGHGEPLLETAQEDYAATFNRMFEL